MRCLILSALLILPTNAPAANWTYVNSAVTGSRTYADLSSARDVGKYKAIWTRVDHSADKSTAHRETKFLLYFDCSEKAFAVKQSAAYDAKGANVEDQTFLDFDLMFSGVIPDSVAAPLLRLVCKD